MTSQTAIDGEKEGHERKYITELILIEIYHYFRIFFIYS